ncbi:phosphate ABC transporter substrate-binding protein PstS [Kribbella albertanoniae]|uniref:Phosphate ABC transporter substrate-binding protein PstS n=1 Tax=Kribbella albertanoniae TaxID=1266829 RepID=A0A4R4PQG2_9ACTN|nr:phosphate ABC transporter substrate-binding protein PstS [Kribbella albertanoniae]TDC24521.1 phosphate ABC transporter substrate-binding protein PstS [Kribbella albertanoniae]
MRRPVRRLGAFVLALLLTLASAALPASAGSTAYVPIYGSGSTWSQNAVDQWMRDVEPLGMRVQYGAGGSSRGRLDFANNLVDFAISEIPYQGKDPLTEADDSSRGRAYAYMPIVAGGTALMYQIQIRGKLYRDLRLSGDTITKIFTGKITNWNDPQITRDNNGKLLPSKKIIPVVRSDGSGTTAQFTLWMNTQHKALWDGFCQSTQNRKCGQTSYFPTTNFPGVKAQGGSAQSAGFIAAPYADGAIGYVEYSYALGKSYPVVKMKNSAGYYTEPNSYNTAVALTRTQIETNKNSPLYLTQKLTGVYNNPDPRTYPLSSYSYMILPTANVSANKGQTLSDFAAYFLCQGQQKAAPLGYSPLPLNLVQAGFQQIARVPGGKVGATDIKKCGNPTFDGKNLNRNVLAAVAPQPLPCDRDGAGPAVNGKCVTASNNGNGNNGNNNGSNNGTGNNNGNGNNNNNGNPNGNGNGNQPDQPGQQPSSGPTGGAVVDPETGQVINAGGQNNGGYVPTGQVTDLNGNRGSGDMLRNLGVLVAVEALLLLLVPTLVSRHLQRKRAGR